MNRAAHIIGVQLWDVDGLQAICNANRAAREAEVAQAEQLVAGEVAKFQAWVATQSAVPTIRALRERAEIDPHRRASAHTRTFAQSFAAGTGRNRRTE
ncbi:MAG: hypothetical protein U0074_04390 [Kouleothrix sp.]